MTIPLIPRWVHSLDDYRSMFDLHGQLMKSSILDFPAGISSFNVEMHQLGFNNVVSADPHYHLSAMDMIKHVDYVIQDLSEQVDQYIAHLNNKNEHPIEDIMNIWNQRAQLFLSDYSVGQKEERYVFAHLPKLPFADSAFELALCCDMMFRDTQFSRENILLELCRVAQEVRIFPLLNQNGDIADELGEIMLFLQNKNMGVEIKEVPYKILKNSNAMLRVWSKQCIVI